MTAAPHRPRRSASSPLRRIAIFALTTPGFTSPISINALLNAISFIGCVAVGMTFITLTGNIMSLCLGATRVGLGAGLPRQPVVRHPAGVPAGARCSASSSPRRRALLVGYFRANPILVSIAGLSLLIGGAALATGGQRIYPGGEGLQMFKGRVAGIPVEALYLLRHRRRSASSSCHGRGSAASWRWSAATRAPRPPPASAPRPPSPSPMCIAGACSAVSGVLLAARYGSGDMEIGAGYDYTAIAAVLVGGTAIQGGSGSVVRTLIGVTVIAIIEVVLLLRGFSQQLQYLITGLIVLCVIMLHTIGERR